MSFIYVASPYSHPQPSVVYERFEAVRNYVAHLLKSEIWCYSPIVHTHEIAWQHDLPTDAAYWMRYNVAMLRVASSLRVLCLDGVDHSIGVAGEIQLATTLDIPILYVTPDDYSISVTKKV